VCAVMVEASFRVGILDASWTLRAIYLQSLPSMVYIAHRGGALEPFFMARLRFPNLQFYSISIEISHPATACRNLCPTWD
jgi:hypothetical protein